MAGHKKIERRRELERRRRRRKKRLKQRARKGSRNNPLALSNSSNKSALAPNKIACLAKVLICLGLRHSSLSMEKRAKGVDLINFLTFHVVKGLLNEY